MSSCVGIARKEAMARSISLGRRACAALSAVLATGGLLAVSSLGSGVAAGATQRAARAATDSYGFNGPDALAADNGDLWVANGTGNSVTELNLATHLWVRTVSAPNDHFNKPVAIVADGSHLFVASQAGTVTELNASNGSRVRVLSAKADHMLGAAAMALVGTDLFVVAATGWVTELNSTTGALLKTTTKYGLDDPTSVVVVGDDLWITNEGSDSVTEVNVNKGSVTRTVQGSQYQLLKPAGIAFDGAHLWVSDSANDSLTEINIFGSLVRVVHGYGMNVPGPITSAVTSKGTYVYVSSPPGSSPMINAFPASFVGKSNWQMCNTNGPYSFVNPQALLVTGDTLWVANTGGNSLTEMYATTGFWIRDIS